MNSNGRPLYYFVQNKEENDNTAGKKTNKTNLMKSFLILSYIQYSYNVLFSEFEDISLCIMNYCDLDFF